MQYGTCQTEIKDRKRSQKGGRWELHPECPTQCLNSSLSLSRNLLVRDSQEMGKNRNKSQIPISHPGSQTYRGSQEGVQQRTPWGPAGAQQKKAFATNPNDLSSMGPTG